MTQFSISAVWYPLWAFVILTIVVFVPVVFPMRRAYRYVLGLSTAHFLKREPPASIQKPVVPFDFTSSFSSEPPVVEEGNEISCQMPLEDGAYHYDFTSSYFWAANGARG